MKTIATFYGIGLLLIGLAYVLAPGALFGLAGGALEVDAAITDFRATYGGVQIAMGWVCLLRRNSASDLYGTFILLSVLIGCVGAVRAMGIFLDGGEQTFNILSSSAEISSVCLTLYCARRILGDINRT